MLTNHVTVLVSLSRLQNGIVFLPEQPLERECACPILQDTFTYPGTSIRLEAGQRM